MVQHRECRNTEKRMIIQSRDKVNRKIHLPQVDKIPVWILQVIWAKSMPFWVDFARFRCILGEIYTFLDRFRPNAPYLTYFMVIFTLFSPILTMAMLPEGRWVLMTA